MKISLQINSALLSLWHFLSGNFDTHFVKNYYSPEILKEQHKEEAKIAAIIALKSYLEDQQLLQLPN